MCIGGACEMEAITPASLQLREPLFWLGIPTRWCVRVLLWGIQLLQENPLIFGLGSINLDLDILVIHGNYSVIMYGNKNIYPFSQKES